MKLHSQAARIFDIPQFPKAENTESYTDLKLGPLPTKIISSLTNPSLGKRLNLFTAA